MQKRMDIGGRLEQRIKAYLARQRGNAAAIFFKWLYDSGPAWKVRRTVWSKYRKVSVNGTTWILLREIENGHHNILLYYVKQELLNIHVMLNLL